METNNTPETNKIPKRRRTRTAANSKVNKKQRMITNILLVVCVAAVIFSAVMIISNMSSESKDRQNISSDANAFDNPVILPPVVSEGVVVKDPYEGVVFPEGILDNFKSFYARNDEIVGWIKIGTETPISYPVMKADNNEKYYRTNLDGKSSREGCIFMDYRVNLEATSPNILVHGHNNKNNLMFGPLEKYNALLYGLDQYKKAPAFTYYSLTEEKYYKIVGLIVANVNWSDGPVFDFTKTQFNTEAEFEAFRDEVYSRSTVSTGVDMQYGDTVMTLHTCAYYFKDARFLVVAREVRPGEDLSVDTSAATVNTRAIVPDSFYAAYNLGVKASDR